MTGYKRSYGFDRIRKDHAFSSELRHQITLKTSASTTDGEGGFVDGWTTVGTTWASVSPITAKQRDYYNSLSTEITHLIKIRGDVTCLDTYQITFDSRIFEVLTVENIQERDIVKIVFCKERSR